MDMEIEIEMEMEMEMDIHMDMDMDIDIAIDIDPYIKVHHSLYVRNHLRSYHIIYIQPHLIRPRKKQQTANAEESRQSCARERKDQIVKRID